MRRKEKKNEKEHNIIETKKVICVLADYQKNEKSYYTSLFKKIRYQCGLLEKEELVQSELFVFQLVDFHFVKCHSVYNICT